MVNENWLNVRRTISLYIYCIDIRLYSVWQFHNRDSIWCSYCTWMQINIMYSGWNEEKFYYTLIKTFSAWHVVCKLRLANSKGKNSTLGSEWDVSLYIIPSGLKGRNFSVAITISLPEQFIVVTWVLKSTHWFSSPKVELWLSEYQI